MKEAFMVQGSYGQFGLTSAMLRRCKEFSEYGVKCTSLTLDFTDNIYSIIEEFRQSGKLDEKTITLNPYMELSDKAIDWQKKLTKAEVDNFLLINSESETIDYYYVNGRLSEEKYIDFKKYRFVNQKYYNGILISQVAMVNGKKKKEFFYSKTGLCIAIKEWNDDETQKGMLIFDYSIGVIRRYKSSYWWNIEWIKEKVFYSFLNNQEKPLLICDGPGTARKLTEISKDIAIRVYVLHHNHRLKDGRVAERDLWNLNNCKKFDAVVALTAHQAVDINKDFPKINNIHVIPNFTNIKNINLEYENGYFKNNRLGFFGQLIELKGVKDAIKAISILNNKYGVPVYLDVYGKSPKNNEEAIKYYTDYAVSLGVGNIINFKGYSNEVLEEMKTCMCVLFPSSSEAQPLTILESLSVGTPVVAYDCKYGPSSMIENGVNGFLINVGDVETMAVRIKDLFHDNEKRNEMSVKAIESAKMLSSKELIFNQWKNLFSI